MRGGPFVHTGDITHSERIGPPNRSGRAGRSSGIGEARIATVEAAGKRLGPGVGRGRAGGVAAERDRVGQCRGGRGLGGADREPEAEDRRSGPLAAVAGLGDGGQGEGEGDGHGKNAKHGKLSFRCVGARGLIRGDRDRMEEAA